MTRALALTAQAAGMPDWASSLVKVVIGGVVVIAVISFFLSSNDKGPKD